MKSRLLYSSKIEDDKIDISLVIPTYKRSKYLFSAIDSILKQNPSDLLFEIIVVNNDPNDNMEEFVNKYKDVKEKISFYSNVENYGQVGNINRGVELSSGRYIAFLHDDDLLLPNYFKEISEYIKNDNNDCIVISQYSLYEKYKVDIKHKIINALFVFRYFYRNNYKEISCKDCVNAF